MRRGFTLVELLVVIAILVILMALTVPVGKSMIVSNQISSCAGNLNRIQQAMKLYALDYQGVPPVWIAENGADTSTPYDEMVDPLVEPVDPSTGQVTNPLMALHRTGYLRDKTALHCPADRVHRSPTARNYYDSYVWRQPDNTPADEMVKYTYQNDRDPSDAWNGTEIFLNRFKYMPCRLPAVPSLGAADPHVWAAAPSSYVGQRQLSNGMRRITVGTAMYWGPVTDNTWMPADSTVIT